MTTTFVNTTSRVSSPVAARRQVSSLPQSRRVDADVLAFRTPVKPRWEREPLDSRSNTMGVGRAAVPTRAQRRTRQRIASPSPAVFDNTQRSIFDRWAHNMERFVTSRGGMSVALGSIVLTLGLSPLLMADAGETAPASAEVSVSQTATHQ